MNTLTIAVASFLCSLQMGTLRGHVVLKQGSYSGYEISIATQPAQAKPGFMHNDLMMFVKRVPLDSKGNFHTSLQPGHYQAEVFRSKGGLTTELPVQNFTITGGKTTSIVVSQARAKRQSSVKCQVSSFNSRD